MIKKSENYKYFKDKDTFKNVEYLEMLDNGQTVAHLDGKEVNGKKKSDVQYLLGKNLEVKIYRACIKVLNDPVLKTFPMKALSLEKFPKNKSHIQSQDKSITFTDEIKKLNDSIALLKNNSNFDIQIIIESVKNAKDAEINFLNLRIKDKEKEISDMEKELDKAQAEINRLEIMIDKANNESGKSIDKYLDLALTFFSKNKQPVNVPKNLLSDKNSIPPEFIDALGTINWKEVPAQSKEKIINAFNTIKTSLPLNNKS